MLIFLGARIKDVYHCLEDAYKHSYTWVFPWIAFVWQPSFRAEVRLDIFHDMYQLPFMNCCFAYPSKCFLRLHLFHNLVSGLKSNYSSLCGSCHFMIYMLATIFSSYCIL